MTPRRFGEAERARIRAALIETATQHFSRFGYRRARVEEMARAVGIGKGTVYLLFETKAELFLAALQEVETAARAELVTEMRGEFPTPAARLRRFLHHQCEALQQHPLLSVMLDPEDAMALMRDLPPERLEALRADDERFYAALAEAWDSEGSGTGIAPHVLGALPRALFAMLLHRELIGEQAFPEVLELVVEGLVRAASDRHDGV